MVKKATTKPAPSKNVMLRLSPETYSKLATAAKYDRRPLASHAALLLDDAMAGEFVRRSPVDPLDLVSDDESKRRAAESELNAAASVMIAACLGAYGSGEDYVDLDDIGLSVSFGIFEFDVNVEDAAAFKAAKAKAEEIIAVPLGKPGQAVAGTRKQIADMHRAVAREAAKRAKGGKRAK